ncbi:MAG TPA: tetratricopeptide repeat protein [Candidatus Polarisedimenticolia bacterium]|nr:tetratricopeptide repeat protein [Candidatus Polarisedimenticolia bacterium]
MNTALRESPLPVLAVLAALFGFVQYLHWSVIGREDLPAVVAVPDEPPLPESWRGEPSSDPGSSAPPAGEQAAAEGPLHEQARVFEKAGRTAEALDRLDASLDREGTRDAARLAERGVLLLRLNRAAEALASLEEARRLGATSAVLHYNLGLAHSRNSNDDEAERAYRRALKRNPLFDEAWHNLGLLLERRGDRAGALNALQRAVDLAAGASRVRPLIALADLLARGDRHDEARKMLEEAISLAPSEPAPRLALAGLEASSQAGLEKARELYSQAARIAPEDPGPRCLQGEFEARLGNRAAAREHFEAALGLDPGHRRSRYDLAMLLLDTERPEDAGRHFEILNEAGPDPRAWFGLARSRRAMRDLGGAEAAYREAIRLARGPYPEAHYNMGILLRDAQRDEEAEAAYRKAIEQDPQYTSAWINLVLMLEDHGRLQEALEAAESAVRSEPANEKCWYLKGRLLSSLGRGEEALVAFTESARLRPGNPRAKLKAAILLAEQGRDEEAIRLYRDVIGFDPRNAVAWFNMGLALGRLGRSEEAVAAYESALAADPDATGAAQNLGVLYARAGRVEDARSVFAEALERAPGDTGLRYNLSLQLGKLGDRAGAIRQLQRLVSLDPGHAPGFRLLARLLREEGRVEEAAIASRRAGALEAAASHEGG